MGSSRWFGALRVARVYVKTLTRTTTSPAQCVEHASRRRIGNVRESGTRDLVGSWGAASAPPDIGSDEAQQQVDRVDGAPREPADDGAVDADVLQVLAPL